MSDAAPSGDDQLAFLSKLQRLFSEGDFTATYKYALLIALADLAVESDVHGSETLYLSIRQLSERFVAMYWNQAREYGTGKPNAAPGFLIQNFGSQAAVVSAIQVFQTHYPQLSLAQARAAPGFRSLISQVAQTVSSNPIKYLQNFGRATDEFLYRRLTGGIKLEPGIAFCLRRFYPLIQQLARAGWLAHIKSNSRNSAILGASDDLEDFMFRASRQSLAALGEALRKLDGPRCFYCAGHLHTTDVDHYVPFSMYPRDIAHNFVLAHPTCNRSKSNALAARTHLERWLERLKERGDQLAEIGSACKVLPDVEVTRRMAHWAYESSAAVGGRAWIARAEFETVDVSYLQLPW